MFDDPSSPGTRPAAVAPVETVQSAAIQRYHSCRWRKPPEEGSPADHCAHRDVQPMAGTTGFDAEAWCPDCQFYKVRRIPKKRSPDEYKDYGY
jgi:hypothetical protein